MNILLLNPPYPYKVIREGRCQHEAAIWDSLYPPLSLATLASYLRDGHRVTIIDGVAEGLTPSSLSERLKALNPDLIISTVSTPTINEDLKLLKEIKGISEAKTAIFGVHATYFAEELIQNDFIDSVILNDPEIPAVRLASGKEEDFEGIIRKSNGMPVLYPRKEKNVSSFKIPSWDLVDLNKYRIPIKREKYVLVSTARGCPYNCSFCVVPSYNGKRVRFREVNEVVEELKAVSKHVNQVFFYTDLFTFRKKYVLDLCEQIIRENIPIHWVCNSRVDTFDREMAEVMRKAGCWMISFGIESGNQKILDLCDKKITLEQSRRAVQVARDADIISVGHFVLGFPGETQETLQQTLDFSVEVDPDFAEFYIATPFPGSRLYESLKSQIRIDWDDVRYDFDPYQYHFDLGKIRKKAYFKFYLRPKKVARFIRLFGVKKIVPMSFSAVRFLSSFFSRRRG